MSVKALTWAFEQAPEGPTEKLFLLVLANIVEDSEFSVSISLADLAEKCCVSQSCASYSMRRLEEKGFIFREPQFDLSSKRRLLPTLLSLIHI